MNELPSSKFVPELQNGFYLGKPVTFFDVLILLAISTTLEQINDLPDQYMGENFYLWLSS